MTLKRTWECDRCGCQDTNESLMDRIEDRPPAGWQIIAFGGSATTKYVLLCRDCMKALREWVEAEKEKPNV